MWAKLYRVIPTEVIEFRNQVGGGALRLTSNISAKDLIIINLMIVIIQGAYLGSSQKCVYSYGNSSAVYVEYLLITVT